MSGPDWIDGAAEPRELTPGMRRMLYTAAALVFGVGVPLLVLTEYTDVLFAWTVAPPITAAFLGACYWSAGVLELFAARERLWSHARVAVPGVLLFTVLTCVPTALNFSHFNLKNPAAYAWIGVYFGVPPVMMWLCAWQARAPGRDEPRAAPMPVWMRGAYTGMALVLVALGVALCVVPGRAPWAWELEGEGKYAHLARMGPYIGIWLLGLGAVAAQAAREGDLARVRCVLAAGLVLPVLQGVALARYSESVRWSSPACWGFLGFLGLLFGVSLAGWRKLRTRPAAAPGDVSTIAAQ